MQWLTQQEAQITLEYLLTNGATWAELFLEERQDNLLNVLDGKIVQPSFGTSLGGSIRILKGKELRFVSFTNPDATAFMQAAKKLLPETKGPQAHVKFTRVFSEILTNNWADHTIEKIANYFKNLHQAVVTKYSIKQSNFAFTSNTTRRQTATSDGAFVTKTNFYTRMLFVLIDSNGANRENAFESFTKGVDVNTFFNLKAQNFNDEAVLEHLAKTATALLTAPRIKGGSMPVVLAKGNGVLFHEAVGHSLEGTAIAEGKSVFTNKLGQKIANENVTLVDDGTIEHEVGSQKYDDEGQINHRRVLIEKGVLKAYLIDQRSAALMADGTVANGAARRESFRHVTTSRMSNTFVTSGSVNEAEILAKTKYGFYVKNMGGGQVDTFTGDFNFGVAEGYLIENGKLKHLVKGASLVGSGAEILMRIDLVGNDAELDHGGMCGSSSGYVPVTTGTPTLRVSAMTVGGE